MIVKEGCVLRDALLPAASSQIPLTLTAVSPFTFCCGVILLVLGWI
jgi:hypothetical protein